MRATEIIRSVLNLIDQIDCADQPETSVITPAPDTTITGVDTNRFKHIFAMLSAERGTDKMYSNSPVEVVADIDSVTTDAGGGWNGPKNPADLRADTISLFPGFQAKNKEL